MSIFQQNPTNKKIRYDDSPPFHGIIQPTSRWPENSPQRVRVNRVSG
jgi:hypothetical protein